MLGYDTVKVVIGSKRNGLTLPFGIKLCSSLVQRYKVHNVRDYVFVFL